MRLERLLGPTASRAGRSHLYNGLLNGRIQRLATIFSNHALALTNCRERWISGTFQSSGSNQTPVHSRLVGLSEAVLNLCDKCVRVDGLAHDASEVGGINGW